MYSLSRIGILGWGAVLLLIGAAVLIAMGVPFAPAWIVGGTVAVLFAYNYPYVTYGAMVFLVPFLGLMVSLPTGRLAIGERAFGGAIDVQIGELAALALLIAWAFKVFRLWVKRRDVNWMPWLPFALPITAIVATHLASAFSAFQPDPMLVAKYTLRPVFWAYLIYVVLTVNFVRSRRRLLMTLSLVAATGILAALMGFASLAFSDRPDQLLRRAHPLSVFGVMPLGDNHNLLAEWLAVTVPITIALGLLVKEERSKRLLMAAAAFQALVALLTFARTLWIVLAFEALLAGFLIWRERLRVWLPRTLVAAVFLIPLAVVMLAWSSTANVRSSTSTRYMLSEIALNFWQASPWIGVGAGTFVDRVANVRVFTLEYGNPMEAHGFGQKLLAEVGLLGLMAVGWFAAAVAVFVRKRVGAHVGATLASPLHAPLQAREREVLLLLAIAAAGAFLYQLFNTNYWAGKLWLPVGLLLAATRALAPRREVSPSSDGGSAPNGLQN